MTRPPLSPDRRRPDQRKPDRRSSEQHRKDESNRFRHTSRADRPAALSLFLQRHKGKLKALMVLGLLGGAGTFILSTHGARTVLTPLKTRIEALVPLKVTAIRIEGDNLTSPEAIHDALGISVGDPMLGFDVRAARDRLNSLPFIENATVGRRFSGLIVVRLTEHPPFAIWQHKGQFIPIDRDGTPIPDKGMMNGKDARAFMQLPLVVGDGADHAAAELLDALAKAPDVRSRMTAATLVNERRWTLTLKDGASVYLPEAAEPQALTRLEELQPKLDLLDRPVEIIDMRLPDRLTIRERPAPAPSPDDAAAQTGPQPAGQPAAGQSATEQAAPEPGGAATKPHAQKERDSKERDPKDRDAGRRRPGNDATPPKKNSLPPAHHDDDHAAIARGVLPA